MTDTQENETGANAFHVGHIALKLPAFMEDDPVSWFNLIEAQFELRYIAGDSTKFYHAVSVLQGEPMRQIKDILNLPKTTPDRYDQLKARLIETYGLEDIDRAEQLIEWPPMSEDERPSVFINGILSMLGNIPKDHAIVRALILSKFPPAIKAMLRSTSNCTNLKEMSREADRIWKGDRARRLSEKTVMTVKPVKSRGDLKNGLCYWHFKFGSKARRCQEFCKWNSRKATKGMAALTLEDDKCTDSENLSAEFQ